MAQGDNFKRNNLPTMQQIRYLTELEKMENRRGNVSMISEICGVHHGSVSRYFKMCAESGLLNDDYTFTRAGREWLHKYQKLIEDLEKYLQNIGVGANEIPASVRQMVESLDYYVLSSMIRSDQEMRKEYSASKRSPGFTMKSFLSDVLAYGTEPVEFVLFRVDAQKTCHLSMANRGFEHPAILRHNKRGSWIQLTIKEMKAESRMTGEAMTGHLASMKYEENGVLQQAEIKEGKLRIPLEACHFTKKQGGEVMGTISVTVTCSVGRNHMPESTAVLAFWL